MLPDMEKYHAHGKKKYVIFKSRYNRQDTIDGLTVQRIPSKVLLRGDEEDVHFMIELHDLNNSWVVKCLQHSEDIIILNPSDRKNRRKATAVPMVRVGNVYIPIPEQGEVIGKMQSVIEGEAKATADYFYCDYQKTYFTYY